VTNKHVERRDAVVHYTVDGVKQTWRIAAHDDDDEESVRAHARRFRPSIVVDKVTFDNGTPPPEEEQQ